MDSRLLPVLLALGSMLLAGCSTGYEPIDVAADPTDPTIGTGNLTVFLYEDYRCSHCNQYSLDGGFDHLRTTWIDPGHITLVFKHVAFVDPQYSGIAAVASRCVATLAPEVWLDYDHDIYAMQREGAPPSSQNLRALAEQHGVGADALDACTGAAGAMDAVAHNSQELIDMGQGTPTIVIEGQPYSAARLDEVDNAIEQALG